MGLILDVQMLKKKKKNFSFRCIDYYFCVLLHTFWFFVYIETLFTVIIFFSMSILFNVIHNIFAPLTDS